MIRENDSGQAYDVFISYAHSDDGKRTGAEFGWVTTVVTELKTQLCIQLGGAGAGVWMDHVLEPNDRVTDIRRDMVRRRRTLVLFMSPGYAKSEWCQRELGNFLQTSGTHDSTERAVIVEPLATDRKTRHS